MVGKTKWFQVVWGKNRAIN